MKSFDLTIRNDGFEAFPQGCDWVADVALFGWESLQGVHRSRGKTEIGAKTLQEIGAADEQEWIDCCYSPQLFSWLTDVEREFAVNDAHWSALATELRADQDAVFLDEGSALPLWRRPLPRFLNRLRSIGQGSRSVSSANAVFLDPQSELFVASVDGMREALRLIGECAPGFLADILTFVRAVVLVDHRASFRGASGLNQCGLIFYSPEEEWSPLRWAEELVHESTHYIVHALDLRDHLVQGENALVEAHPGPFRPDLRHHHGNFHGLCVVGRLVVLFDCFAESGVAVNAMREKRVDYIARSKPAYAAMLDSATLNPIGNDLFHQIIAPMFQN